ncbi:MAG: SIS domain-containing protein [Alphaproteobacteria bacterium]|nr:SIS domain-containing protein [Alphaproteobacteria bacterium]
MTALDLSTYWKREFDDHANVLQKTMVSAETSFENILNDCTKSIQSGGKIIFFGNGGSAADAQHLATELTVRYVKDRKAIAAIALTTDTSTLTAAGNDLGFDHIFARQIEALGKPEDVVIAISTSGNSPNVLEALKTAKNLGLKTVGFSGRDGGKMKSLCDHMVIVPSDVTARIQEMHILIGHLLCGGLEQKLGLV